MYARRAVECDALRMYSWNGLLHICMLAVCKPRFERAVFPKYIPPISSGCDR